MEISCLIKLADWCKLAKPISGGNGCPNTIESLPPAHTATEQRGVDAEISESLGANFQRSTKTSSSIAHSHDSARTDSLGGGE